ncbi:TPA: hypothetical protein N7N17_004666 [Escherichia coli]|nr:hypothetical protein [Escherichia coli]HCO2055232.1 hypothetical protein [Escherichia coli]HCO2063379.1 hypothetical protein [Escherichia coli]HCO2066849.1 hypothetical protein [Escherichia coli]
MAASDAFVVAVDAEVAADFCDAAAFVSDVFAAPALVIGWRSLWYTWGQKETGEWQWTFQVGDLENVNITHWAVMPKAPEAGA